MNLNRQLGLVLVCLGVLQSFAMAQQRQEEIRDGALSSLFDKFRMMRAVKEQKEPGGALSVKLQTITFNEDPITVGTKRYDAFRFKVTPDGTGFAWIFDLPENVDGWYILPQKGTMEGFKGYSRLESGKFVQGLPTGTLKFPEEYLIWFSFTDDKPTKISLGFTFTDLEANEEGRVSGNEVLKRLFPDG